MITNTEQRQSFKFSAGNYMLQIKLDGEDGGNLKTIERHFALTPEDSSYIRAGQGINFDWNGTEYLSRRSLHNITMQKR